MIRFRSLTLLVWVISVVTQGCAPRREGLAPLSVPVNTIQLRHLPTLLKPFTDDTTPWGVELKLGRSFAQEGDFYRAITCFKRALILLPADMSVWRLHIQYAIVLSYCLAGRWKDALEAYRSSDLDTATPEFEAYNDLLLLLQEILLQNGDGAAAERLDVYLDERARQESQLSRQLQLRQWQSIEQPIFRDRWSANYRDPRRASMYQALLPGAGYAYVGQKKAALTSFMVNALTVWGIVTLAKHRQWSGVALLGSMEVGWYFGGIQGAALAAQQWNDQLGSSLAYPILRDDKVYPLLRITHTF